MLLGGPVAPRAVLVTAHSMRPRSFLAKRDFGPNYCHDCHQHRRFDLGRFRLRQGSRSFHEHFLPRCLLGRRARNSRWNLRPDCSALSRRHCPRHHGRRLSLRCRYCRCRHWRCPRRCRPHRDWSCLLPGSLLHWHFHCRHRWSSPGRCHLRRGRSFRRHFHHSHCPRHCHSRRRCPRHYRPLRERPYRSRQWKSQT